MSNALSQSNTTVTVQISNSPDTEWDNLTLDTHTLLRNYGLVVHSGSNDTYGACWVIVMPNESVRLARRGLAEVAERFTVPILFHAGASEVIRGVNNES